VLRGGAWNHNANNLRCAERNNNTPDNANNNIGFRCVRGIRGGSADHPVRLAVLQG
jgi:formylglycine-generating enzyme required for sulfatase activity